MNPDVDLPPAPIHLRGRSFDAQRNDRRGLAKVLNCC